MIVEVGPRGLWRDYSCLDNCHHFPLIQITTPEASNTSSRQVFLCDYPDIDDFAQVKRDYR